MLDLADVLGSQQSVGGESDDDNFLSASQRLNAPVDTMVAAPVAKADTGLTRRHGKVCAAPVC